MCKAEACHAWLRNVFNKHILVYNAPGVTYFAWSIHNRCMWWVIAKLELSCCFCWVLLKRCVFGRPTSYDMYKKSLSRAGYNIHCDFDKDSNLTGMWVEVNATQYEEAKRQDRVCTPNGKHVRVRT